MDQHGGSETNNLTLVIGGTGKTGRRVAERLTAGGVPIRIGSRTGEPRFDWEDETTWAPALRDVGSVYVTYYSDLAFPGASDRVQRFVDLAEAHGVRRLVLLSGRNEEGALLGEKAVRESGVEWTIVRSSFFAQDFSEYFLLDSVQSGVIAFPAGDVQEPFIDVEDIADVAAAALMEDRHVGEIYEVTGPRLLTFADAAAEISRAAGREIQYLPVSAEEYGAALAEAGLSPSEVKDFVDLFTEITDGRSAYLGDGVQRALGREPRNFADFARDAAATGVWAEPMEGDAR